MPRLPCLTFFCRIVTAHPFALLGMLGSSRKAGPIPPERRAIFDKFVYNNLPRHLLHLKTIGMNSEDFEIEVISASQLSSVFETELGDIFRHDKNSRMSGSEIRKRLGELLRFAIFSHRWFQEGEPSYRAVDSCRPFTRGYHKLINFCEKAAQFGCKLAWADTCCIDKTSSAELDEAIRSMFRWYRLAHVCIVHLPDTTSNSLDELEKDEWFTRGWTLQELLAPWRIKFYGENWKELTNVDNDKDHDELMERISKITNIPAGDLRKFEPGTNRIRERMSWASRRITTRAEDIAYSLIGIFDINLPIAYGEGTWAFHRLMEVIILRCDEWGIFAWAGSPSTHHSRTNSIPQSPACYHLIDISHFPTETREKVHGDTSFTLSRQGLLLTVMIAIGDIERKTETEVDEPDEEQRYVFTVKPSYAGPTFETVQIRSSVSIAIEGYDWAIGILNYREVEPKGEYGKLEGDKAYVTFLLCRVTRRDESEPEGPWVRVPTENILIVDTLFQIESREPVQRLSL